MRLTVTGNLPDDFSEIDSALLRKIRADGFSGVAGGIEAIEALGREGRQRLKGLFEDEGMILVSPFVVTQTHLRPDDPERPQVVERFRPRRRSRARGRNRGYRHVARKLLFPRTLDLHILTTTISGESSCWSTA